ncbi:hypothetical protein OG985_09765 [Streptomyces sp. NBC_00289]|uniref:hypothetical protein n=1 Tax=Streptomyces sp. NBC_00289 TaxID=2975703 RepID=UPI003253A4B9
MEADSPPAPGRDGEVAVRPEEIVAAGAVGLQRPSRGAAQVRALIVVSESVAAAGRTYGRSAEVIDELAEHVLPHFPPRALRARGEHRSVGRTGP